jgi:hypothetical protein
VSKNESNVAAMAQNLATSESGDTSLSDLEREIDAGVEQAHARVRGEEPAAEESASEEPADEPPVKADPEQGEDKSTAEEPEGSQGRDDRGQFTRKAPLSDALLERAVRAGIPMSEARQFQVESLLDATVRRLEGVQKVGAEGKPGAEGKGGEVKPAADDPMAAIDAIPDEWPEEQFDPKLASALKTLKGFVKSQAQEIASLRSKGSQDFFATQLEGVKDFVKGDQSKVTALRDEFDALKAGYAAAGKSVPDAEVFNRAARLVLGGEMQAKANKDKAEAVARRNGQKISRASGHRIEGKSSDPIQDVGNEIQAKFFS